MQAVALKTAPPILTDIEVARSFIRSLDRASDLMETACAAAVVVALALDAHLEREGKDNHALALLETAQWLHARLAQLLEVWRSARSTRSRSSRYGASRAAVERPRSSHPLTCAG